MAFSCHRPGVFANEEIEVCAKMCLLHVNEVKFGIATGVVGGFRGPCGAAGFEVCVGAPQLQDAVTGGHAAAVAGLRQGQNVFRRGCSRIANLLICEMALATPCSQGQLTLPFAEPRAVIFAVFMAAAMARDARFIKRV